MPARSRYTQAAVALVGTVALSGPAGAVRAAHQPGQQRATHQAVAESPAAREVESGRDHLRHGRTAEAVAALKRALAIDPKSGLAHQLLAEAYLLQGSYDMLGEARAELLEALALDPSLVWARFHLARLYLDFGDAAKAREQLDVAIRQRPDIPHVQSLLGEAERQLARPRDSIERQHQALRLDPTFTPARYYLGLALLDVEEADAALAALEAAAASNLPIVDLYLTLGSVHERAGRLDRARALFERAVKIAPSRPEGRLRLARVQRRQGEPARALEELSRALPAGQRLLATEYYQRLEADVHLERGRALQDLQRRREAARAYQDALAVLPDLGEAHRDLAEVLYRLGQYTLALEHAGRAAALGCPVPAELLSQIEHANRRETKN